MRAKYLVAAALLAATSARASVEISSDPTQNMNCQAGVCTPTTKKAVLNVTDLANMLASGDVRVTTSSVTSDIELHAALSWASTSHLTLDAERSVILEKPMTVAGMGALTITTNDGGKNGEFAIFPEQGNVQFWNLASSLVIDGQSYTLVGDIHTLASDITANPSGFYALANDYDASVDGTYTQAPISSGACTGTVEGLGNAIIRLQIKYKGEKDDPELGLFDLLWGSTVRDLGILRVSISNKAKYGIIGALTGLEYKSTIVGCYSSGEITGTNEDFLGGLVGMQNGEIGHKSSIIRSHSSVGITGYDDPIGGLVGSTSRHTVISESYATGNISGGPDAFAGGLGPVLNKSIVG